MNFKGKKVLVTGGTGLIGRPLVNMLLEKGSQVRVVSLDQPIGMNDVEFQLGDLTEKQPCFDACKDIDCVFHLAGVKGGVGIGKSKAAEFFFLNTIVNLQMLEAARKQNVQDYLFTSSIGAYPDAEIYSEDDLWSGLPHESDKYGGWSKRIGELQCSAYFEQYGMNISVVRPANIYGPYDNFNPKTAMVVGALVNRVCSGEDPLIVWGDGSASRDFLFSEDCAEGILKAMDHASCDPLNLGSGRAVSVKYLVESICKAAEKSPEIVWDTTKPSGNAMRLMNISKAKKCIGFEVHNSIGVGIKKTVNWYLDNQDHGKHRFSPFSGV